MSHGEEKVTVVRSPYERLARHCGVVRKLDQARQTAHGLTRLQAAVRLWGIWWSLKLMIALLCGGGLLLPLAVAAEWYPQFAARSGEAIFSVLIAVGIAAVVCWICIQSWREF